MSSFTLNFDKINKVISDPSHFLSKLNIYPQECPDTHIKYWGIGYSFDYELLDKVLELLYMQLRNDFILLKPPTSNYMILVFKKGTTCSPLYQRWTETRNFTVFHKSEMALFLKAKGDKQQ